VSARLQPTSLLRMALEEVEPISLQTVKHVAEVAYGPAPIGRCSSRATQIRINARKAAGLDARDDEKWLATELDFLSIHVDALKELNGSTGSE
jgi:hypothetical protein